MKNLLIIINSNIYFNEIYSQTFGYGHWCRKYQVMEKVRTTSSLIIDFKEEATEIIFDYINGYKK